MTVSGNYYDANVWIYRNRFENVIDDPYEPETYAYNNHFFQNTLINTHRMTSLAPVTGMLLGPIYIYNNMQIVTKDPTGEAVASSRINSAFKLDFSSTNYVNGGFVFNNSIDVATANTNGYGVDALNATMKNIVHINNVYRTLKPMVSKSALTLTNSLFDYDMSQISMGYVEPNGYPNTEVQFTDLIKEDLRLKNTSPARGKSMGMGNNLQMNGIWGFETSQVIMQGADLGAFQYGESDFRMSPKPKYLVPPGGEPSGFGNNRDWPVDSEGGINPVSGPMWRTEIVTTINVVDTNGDGKVDLVDFGIWKSNYLVVPPTMTLVDFTIWKKEYLGV